MDTLINLISFIFIFIGSITILIGSLGLLRLPDVFSRIHAVGMIDTAGIGFIIFGLGKGMINLPPFLKKEFSCLIISSFMFHDKIIKKSIFRLKI